VGADVTEVMETRKSPGTYQFGMAALAITIGNTAHGALTAWRADGMHNERRCEAAGADVTEVMGTGRVRERTNL
jgi:hypothetical protein